MYKLIYQTDLRLSGFYLENLHPPCYYRDIKTQQISCIKKKKKVWRRHGGSLMLLLQGLEADVDRNRNKKNDRSQKSSTLVNNNKNTCMKLKNLQKNLHVLSFCPQKVSAESPLSKLEIMSSSPDGPQAKQTSSSNILSHTSSCPKWNNLNELFHRRGTG